MGDSLRIFVADVVPFANRGEEAIVRGIADLMGDGRPVEIALFDYVDDVHRADGITRFPREWVYSISGGSLSAWSRIGRIGLASVLLRAGLAPRMNRLLRGTGRFAEMRGWFTGADYVIVGHDGVFCPESCGVLHLAKTAGRRAGILGAGVSRYPYVQSVIRPLYRRAIREADFCVFRERSALRYMQGILDVPGKMVLAPDPAFAMAPESGPGLDAYLGQLPQWCAAGRSGRLRVGVTVCQKSALLRRAFPQAATLKGQMDLHVCYLARVLDAVVSRLNASVFFLPHSLEPGERNDVSTAQAVSGRMQTPAEHRHVLAEELTARRLKGIVSRCDLLVGQRAHSLIGSASCETPFVALITSNDRRTHEILGDVFGCERQLVDIDRTPEEEAASRIAEIAGDATAIRQALQRRMAQCREELARVAAMVRGTRR